jgi:outer membrane protein OmpA-like peptidoglycan-associated protein
MKDSVFADVDLVLDRLDLTTATPYAATFLGLEIAKGTLTVKSRVKIEDGDIAAENRIRVDQLTYGKGVKSDKATILPIRLLTDILRDRNGDIVLVLPVKAKTDDEKLVGTIVGQAVGDVLFPPGSPLRSIPFDGCSAELTEDARRRLRNLAEALEERQAMKIVAVGFVDRDADERACVERVAADKAAKEKAPGPVLPGFLALQGDARLGQIAAARAETVRSFLVEPGKVDPSRLSALAGNVDAVPMKKGEAKARVEFTEAAY